MNNTLLKSEMRNVEQQIDTRDAAIYEEQNVSAGEQPQMPDVTSWPHTYWRPAVMNFASVDEWLKYRAHITGIA